METAKPALSSAGEVIWEPEDNRASDWFSMLLDWLNSVAVFCAAMFVLTTMLITNSFLESPRLGALIWHNVLVVLMDLLFRHPPLFPPAVCGRRSPLITPSHRQELPGLK
jgi:hypothetical protein